MSPHSGEQVRRQCIHHNVSSRSATQQKPRGAASPTSGDGPGSQPHRQIESRVAEAKGNASTIRGPHVMFAARPCPGSPDRPENGPRSRLLPTDGSDCRSWAGATPTQPSCIASYDDLENTLGSLAFIRHPSPVLSRPTPSQLSNSRIGFFPPAPPSASDAPRHSPAHLPSSAIAAADDARRRGVSSQPVRIANPNPSETTTSTIPKGLPSVGVRPLHHRPQTLVARPGDPDTTTTTTPSASPQSGGWR